MNRRTFATILAATAALTLTPATSLAKPKKATIVMPISVVAGKTHEEVMPALKKLVAEIRNQPGLIDEDMMAGKFERPNFVYVTVWEKQSNWEAMFGNEEFLKTLEDISPVISLQTADVYRPMKME
ncbi:antibiotic biosynthesis monooxygenase [Microvirga sp. W0021]|uniref:Antibiotic biosynthesis monooxygenase n=1 Tax=Hohaiivirga grylli TaxID=3133970 RepID=A0ABV0BN62_9HYPH